MNNFTKVSMKNISVMCITAKGGVKNASNAFIKLESKLHTLKQRKFYGCLIGDKENGTYKACVQIIESDNPKEMNLETWIIPKGKYLKAKIKDWNTNLSAIGETIKNMSMYLEVDSKRPTIEFYKSKKELNIYLPIS